MESKVSEFLFHQGTNFHAYRYLGCHAHRLGEEGGGYFFRTWAPNARAVALVGDMTDWGVGLPLFRESERGVWSLFLPAPQALAGQKYKFAITGQDGTTRLKGDPYARHSEGGAGGASLIPDETPYEWQDGLWMERRQSMAGGGIDARPLHIYELHFSSFARREGDVPFSYREMAELLIGHVKRTGFTHVEFLPLAEHPYDGSWGYQVTGYYAPTSRFGTPDDFRYLVDRLHCAGIGVLMDWVPAHFPRDGWGLFEFDGQPLYEYQGDDRREAHGWGTRYFDVGREEIQCFLVSNALYWLREFHLDGLRVDAVASMLYRDYDRPDGAWFPNSFGGRENLEAIAFFRKLNAAVRAEFPDVLMIAEESTAFPGVTTPPEDGGLGFTMKWNMGFANDFFSYLGKEGIFRRYHHAALTFPMMYAYSEKFVLPVSHDEVVHGKGSFLSKISGNEWERMETMRAAFVFYMTFPGKKLFFMGNEFAAPVEWNWRQSLDWHLLRGGPHADFYAFFSALSQLYLESPALYEQDFSPAGFEWIDADRADDNLIAYRRIAKNGDSLTVVIGFGGADVYDYRLALREAGKYEVVFFSGHADTYEKGFTAETDEGGHYLMMRVPARTAIILRRKTAGERLVFGAQEGGERDASI